MTEGAQIDYGGHANNMSYVACEVMDFDQVIGKALQFADADGQTLVIVTADHETGGKDDFQYGNTPSSLYPATKVDHVLHDGEEVKLGGATLVATGSRTGLLSPVCGGLRNGEGLTRYAARPLSYSGRCSR